MVPVLITGAGPTGLVLALWLTQAGIKVRIIDKTSEPGTTSRALAVHARTLEFYKQLGISEKIAEQGFHFPNVNLWVNQKIKATFPIGKVGEGKSPFPYVLIFPQDEHENLLIQELKKLGVEVERNTELLSFSDSDSQHIKVELKLPSGQTETVLCSYLAGCDGAKSIIRHQLKMDFEGSTYPDLFYVADIEGTGLALNGELNLALDQADFLAIFPLKKKGHARLIGVLRDVKEVQKIEWEDVNPRMLKTLKIEVKSVNWFSTYHVHHRVASHFQVGRVFLLGDAGHIHSPVGGQGMNTGIGDAVNLAWKLAQVLKEQASSEILKSYEPERIAFARQLVKTTDQAFKIVTSKGPLARFVRTKIIPFIMPKVFNLDLMKPFIFRTLSQTGISYRHVQLNQGQAEQLFAGDRLPWVESVDNFSPLRSLTWQVHIYGDQKIKSSVLVFHFPWNDEMSQKGLQKNVAYLIRPDGYIGFISNSAETSEIEMYLQGLKK